MKKKEIENSPATVNSNTTRKRQTKASLKLKQANGATEPEVKTRKPRGSKTKNDPEFRAKRTKERTISDIIEKVTTWRKLYNGVLIDNDDIPKPLYESKTEEK